MLSERKQTTAVAICTERVEAKNVNPTWLFGYDVAICTERVEAKVHFNFIRTIDKPLQSARGVWKTLHHPPEKNPRKFMQTYCIFIHLGV